MEDIDNDDEDTWRDITADLEGLGVDPASVPSHQSYIKRWLEEVVFGESAEGVESQDQLDGLDDTTIPGNPAADLFAGATSNVSGGTLDGGHEDWGSSEELSRLDLLSVERCPSAGSHRSKDSNWRPFNEPNPDYVQNLLSKVLKLEYSGNDDPNVMLVPIKRVYHQADWTDRGYLYRTEVEHHCRSATSQTDFSCDDQELIEIVRSEDKNRDGKIDCSEFVEIIHRLVDVATKDKEEKFQQLVKESNLQGSGVSQYEQKLLWSTRPDPAILPWGWKRDYTPSEGIRYTSPLGAVQRRDPEIPVRWFTSIAFNAARVCIPRISQAQEKWGRHTAKMSKDLSNEYQEALELVLLAASNFVILESSNGPTKFSDLDNMVAMAELIVLDDSPEFDGCPVAILRDLQLECYSMLTAIQGFVFELKHSESIRGSMSWEMHEHAIKQDDCSDSPPSIREWRRLQMPARATKINSDSGRWDSIQETIHNCRAWIRSHPELESRVVESLQYLDNIKHSLVPTDEREIAARRAEATVRQGLKDRRASLQLTVISAEVLVRPDLFSKLTCTLPPHLELFHGLLIPDPSLGPPDPVVVITIDDQERRTEAIPKTQNPYWNEKFDLYDCGILRVSTRGTVGRLTRVASNITEDSVLHIKVINQKNWKKSEEGGKGFLGSDSFRIGNLITLKTGVSIGTLHHKTHLRYRGLTLENLRMYY